MGVWSEQVMYWKKNLAKTQEQKNKGAGSKNIPIHYARENAFKSRCIFYAEHPLPGLHTTALPAVFEYTYFYNFMLKLQMIFFPG